MNNRTQLGSVQRHVLGVLQRSSHGTWHRGAGWVYDCQSVTTKIMESLCRYGLVEKFQHPRHPVAYRLTDAGRARRF